MQTSDAMRREIRNRIHVIASAAKIHLQQTP